MVECLSEGCGVEFDPRRCPSCSHLNDPQGETCAKCGEPWDPSLCPLCGGNRLRGHTKAELLYAEAPEGTLCLACGNVWRPSLQGEGDACPRCHGTDLGTAYPEIPNLEGEPELQVILWAEGCIPRAENGGILHRDMLSWLRYHGVRDRAEILAWEDWFRFVGAERSRLTEEMMAPPETDETRDREEE